MPYYHKLATLLQVLEECEAHKLISIQINSANNCILGFNVLTVFDNEGFRSAVFAMMNASRHWGGLVTCRNPAAKIYDSMRVIGVKQQRGVPRTAGRDAKALDWLDSIRVLEYNAGDFAKAVAV